MLLLLTQMYLYSMSRVLLLISIFVALNRAKGGRGAPVRIPCQKNFSHFFFVVVNFNDDERKVRHSICVMPYLCCYLIHWSLVLPQLPLPPRRIPTALVSRH